MIAKTMIVAVAAAAGFVQAAPSTELVPRQNSLYASYCPKLNGVTLKVIGTTFKIACGTDIDAHGDLFAKTAETAKDCSALCLVYGSGCHAVTWNPYNQRCYGKAEPFTTLSNSQGISLTIV
ncbi:hypothetical protein HJFPF1_07143 [Paramyrothecium foliicola]|nr:hypothetical protein HJFPF1_07143 [Paramyrothecium foliicola]